MQTASCFPALRVRGKRTAEPPEASAQNSFYPDDSMDFSKCQLESCRCRGLAARQKALHYESLSGNFATLFYCNSNHVVFAFFV